jgi:hypothetical protein
VNYANSADQKKRAKNRPILNDALGEQFGELLYDACLNILTVTKGAVYICMSSSELDVLQKAFRAAGGHWSTFVIWAKNTFTLGRSDYQRQYEPILYGWKEGVDHYWCGARDQGDIWLIDKPAKNDLHPTMKPVELVERAIRNSSKSRDIVLDPFGGSGTTLIAAERTARSARLVELDRRYVDVIVERWQNQTGKSAMLSPSGPSFTDLASGESFRRVTHCRPIAPATRRRHSWHQCHPAGLNRRRQTCFRLPRRRRRLNRSRRTRSSRKIRLRNHGTSCLRTWLER